jgi:hypothetical protein
MVRAHPRPEQHEWMFIERRTIAMVKVEIDGYVFAWRVRLALSIQ